MQSHAPAQFNLVGQKIGRKGLETREKIVAATLCLLQESDETPITLTRVARETGVGLATLYLYFPDLGDLILEALERVMASAGKAYLDQLNTPWPECELDARCAAFLKAHHDFWNRNTRVLHLRNSYADARDIRFHDARQRHSFPVIELLIGQMGSGIASPSAETSALATVLLMGLERVASIVTGTMFFSNAASPSNRKPGTYIGHLLASEARVMALAIRDERARLGLSFG